MHLHGLGFGQALEWLQRHCVCVAVLPQSAPPRPPLRLGVVALFGIRRYGESRHPLEIDCWLEHFHFSCSERDTPDPQSTRGRAPAIRAALRTSTALMNMRPERRQKHPATGKAEIASWSTFKSQWLALPEPDR